MSRLGQGVFFVLGIIWFLNSLLVGAARADEDAADADDNSDIETGELGSIDDDVNVASRRAPPRVVVDPSIRTAFAHKFSNVFSAEIYGRGEIGTVLHPMETRTASVAAGVITNINLGFVVWSNSFQATQHYRDFYDRLNYDGYELTTAMARAIKINASAWTITPRVSLGYRWASDPRFERVKTEFMAPLTYKISKKVELSLTPKIDWQVYTERPDNRRDVTGYVAAGVKYELATGANITGSIGYETRSSNIARFDFSRWKLAPQLSLRKEI